ncbi:FecR family protein [Rhodohalobacter sp.]|uniref:FecR family protein n=1 Tax=Rhodohalobacter sp. TaxID=1974210 RepID=UPI002ACEE582|nr:FecR domain-containing protein [Rhodohalobacter sp.]MDZ7756723.1 FecR domain-containing protein [Rhodohalobacter sp.]
MTSNNNIPENDRDLRLSKAYDQIVSGRIEPTQIDDPLFKLLQDAKAYQQESNRSIAVRDKDEARKSIFDQINSTEQNDANPGSATIYSLSRRKWIWAAAAVALILFTSIFLLRQTTQIEPTLIADAGESITTVELQDGSNVTLRPNSQLYQNEISDQQISYSLSGEALFEVSHNPNREFQVETAEGRVRVLGTTFNLSERNSETSVYLIEGRVAFETLDLNQSVTLSPGEGATIQDMKLSESFRFEETNVTSWTQNRLTFSERPAGSIADELEFHFGIEIEMGESMRSEILGGSITLEDREQSLNDLEVVLGGTFVQIDENRYRFQQQQ